MFPGILWTRVLYGLNRLRVLSEFVPRGAGKEGLQDTMLYLAVMVPLSSETPNSCL